MQRAFCVIATVLVLAACGGSSTAPALATAATTSRWALSGTIRDASNVGLPGATVAILDGPDAGKNAISDNAGRYAFTGLTPAGFTIKITLSGYQDSTKAVMLTADIHGSESSLRRTAHKCPQNRQRNHMRPD